MSKDRVEQFRKAQWNEATPRFGRRLVRILILDALLVALLIAACELAVRRYAPSWSRYVFSRTITGGHPYALNSRGLRDREFPIQKPLNEDRVVCLGNSITWGAGLSRDDAYPNQLERLLAQRRPGRSHLVINAAGQGGNLSDATEFMRREGLAMGPRVVTLGLSTESIAVLWNHRPVVAGDRAAVAGNKADLTAAEGRFLSQMVASLKTDLNTLYLSFHLLPGLDEGLHRCLFQFGFLSELGKLDRSYFAFGFDAREVDLNQCEQAYALLLQSLLELRDLLGAAHLPLLVVGLPARFRISDDARDNDRQLDTRKIRIEPMQRIGRICAAAAIPYLDLTPRFRQERAEMLAGRIPWNDLYVRPLDSGHLNPRGTEIVAEEMERMLEKMNVIASPAHAPQPPQATSSPAR